MMSAPRKTGRPARAAVPAAVLALSLLLGAAPGLAGTEHDPEIVDPCGNSTFPTTEKVDICAGWFRGLWTPAPDDQGWQLEGLEIVLLVDGDVEALPQHGGYLMAWTLGECRQTWRLFAELDMPEWRLIFRHNCPDPDDSYGRVIPPEQLDIDGRRITVRLLVAGELAPIASALTIGTELSVPQAWTWLNVATSQAGALTVEWDATAPGRTFVIGQDMPDM